MENQRFIWLLKQKGDKVAQEPERPHFKQFDRLTDEELCEAIIMHIKKEFILKNPGKCKEADEVTRDIVSTLSSDQLKRVHHDTFFANKEIGSIPRNPYDVAMELIKGE
jgi:hypothetical protein